jgi:hypothetical protein
LLLLQELLTCLAAPSLLSASEETLDG